MFGKKNKIINELKEELQNQKIDILWEARAGDMRTDIGFQRLHKLELLIKDCPICKVHISQDPYERDKGAVNA
jgi:hypothetical protein